MNDEINDYLNYVFDGDAILFVGSGFSSDNTNGIGEKIPLASELSTTIQTASGIPNDQFDSNLDLQAISEYFIEQKGKKELVDILKKTFTVYSSLEWQNDITAFNWKRIYTSNYDNVIEIASNVAHKHRPAISISSKEETQATNIKDGVVHLNGFIDDITEDNLDNSTKLTSSSYTDTNFLDSSWKTEFDIDLEHSKAVFFIGFSLNYDLDLKRIIASNKEYKKKIFFINGDKLNVVSKSSLSKFGNVTSLTGQDFSRLLVSAKNNYIPKEDYKIRTFSFKKSSFNVTKEKITDKDVLTILSSGQINENKLYSANNESSYTVKRYFLENAIDIIKNKKVLMVDGKLGNGKSIFLKSLECRLTFDGYQVYSFNGNPNDILDDMEKIKRIKETVIIIIDDYYSIKSEFKYFTKLSDKNFKFIISSRTSINNNNIYNDFVAKTRFNEDEIININVDEVDNEEIEDTVNLLSNHNLWGKKSSYSRKQKKNIVKKISKGGFKNIALETVKSNNIISKLNTIYIDLPIKAKNLVMVLLINNLIKSNLTIPQMRTLTGTIDLPKNIFDNPNLKEFIDIENNNIIIKSSIASNELLKTEKNKKIIIDLMIVLLKTADKIDAKKTYEYLKKALVSFSNFKLIMSGVRDEDLNNFAGYYYDEIKNIKFTKENPFFWLQYGIQKLNEKDYELANIFFDNALGHADKKGFSDFYQINAQKARGIVENTISKNLEVSQSYVEFEKAHNLLVSDLEKTTNRKEYQLSQGKLYELYYDKYYNSLEINQRFDFKNKTKVFNNYLEKYLILFQNKNERPNFKMIQSARAIQRILRNEK